MGPSAIQFHLMELINQSLARFIMTTDQNRSLLRGIEILKTFKPGIDLLGNDDIAERTQLPKATVSRLTQTLVACGMLEHDQKHRAYRLAAPVLSLAFAMKQSSPLLNLAAPKMRLYAEKHKVNIGLAVADGLEMVYLESLRYSTKAAFRNVVAGLRVPMELTSLGRAWLYTLEESQREGYLQELRRKRPKGWQVLRTQIQLALLSLEKKDYCQASWQPGVLALSTPLSGPTLSSGAILNISVSQAEGDGDAQRLALILLELKKEIVQGKNAH